MKMLSVATLSFLLINVKPVKTSKLIEAIRVRLLSIRYLDGVLR